MKHILPYIFATILCLLLAGTASAEVIKLKSGSKVTGTIIFQNDEAIVIKDASGARFQYMMSDVEAILDEEEDVPLQEAPEKTRVKKVSVALEFAGGLASVPKHQQGGEGQVNFSVGSANLLDKRIFLGAGLGAHVIFLGGKNYTFVPLQLKFAAPFTTQPNAPMVGVSLGYGIAATKQVKGGMCADLQLGWRHEMARGRALFLGAYSHFQQAQITLTEEVDYRPYTGLANRCLVGYGLRLGLFL